MQLLKLLGYRGLALRDLMPYIRGEKQGKVIGLSFNDGYQDNLIHALPVLKAHGFTATCYIVSDLCGKYNEWDQGQGQPKAIMTAQEVRAWHQNGMEVGCHTLTHSRLTKCNQAEAKRQINLSKQQLENMISSRITSFCYPYGSNNQTIRELVEAAGFEHALDIKKGLSGNPAQNYCIPRITIQNRTHTIRFLVKLWTNYERRQQKSLKKTDCSA